MYTCVSRNYYVIWKQMKKGILICIRLVKKVPHINFSQNGGLVKKLLIQKIAWIIKESYVVCNYTTFCSAEKNAMKFYVLKLTNLNSLTLSGWHKQEFLFDFLKIPCWPNFLSHYDFCDREHSWKNVEKFCRVDSTWLDKNPFSLFRLHRPNSVGGGLCHSVLSILWLDSDLTTIQFTF